MVEKMTFDMSGLIKDKEDIREIELWGHDAGEFVSVEDEGGRELVKRQDASENR